MKVPKLAYLLGDSADEGRFRAMGGHFGCKLDYCAAGGTIGPYAFVGRPEKYPGH
jgi:hypothetical protein